MKLPSAIGIAIFWSTAASAISGEFDGAEDSRYLTESLGAESRSYTIAPQLTPANPLNLTSEEALLGRKDLNPNFILSTIAPGYADCAATTKGEMKQRDFQIRYFDIQCSGFKILDAELIIQERQGLLSGVTLGGIASPQLVTSPPKFSISDFRPITEIAPQFFEGSITLISSDRVLMLEGFNLTPAWKTVWTDNVLNGRFVTILDADSGSQISQRMAGVHLDVAAQVFPRSPLDINTTQVSLKNLSGTNLDGPVFSVSAGKDQHRSVAGQQGFMSDPFSANSTADFDQIQTYYGAARAAEWFTTKFGYNPGTATIHVTINKLIDNSPNNAAYFSAAEGGPEIQVGPGDGSVLANLGRDTDVVTHEFSHHVIFRRLTRTAGESGVIHEGTADYFTYALNNDPYLGRSIKPGAVSLRTAALGPDGRLDNTKFASQRHLIGQIWSAMLWDLRTQIGAEAADAIAFHAIDYWNSGAGYSDALLGILQADRDLHPRPAADPEFGVFGEFKCQIFKHAVARGFAQLMENLDAKSCDLDMPQLAAESRAYSESIKNGDKKKGMKFGFSFAGVKCGTIGTADPNKVYASTEPWLWLFMFMPLIAVLVPRKKSPIRESGIAGGSSKCN